MKRQRGLRLLLGIVSITGLAAPGSARAEDALPASAYAGIFGRYAPGGDCAREPRITAEASGLTIEVAGAREKIEKPDIAYSYGGNYYEGIGVWIFPYASGEERPILFAFNAGEKPGALTVEPHDRGWDGGPKLEAKHQALVDASPYAKCR